MSDKDSSNNSGEPLPDLSALNFGPAWARDKPSGKPRKQEVSRGGRRDDRQNDGDRNKNKGQGRRDQRGGRDGGGQRQSSGGRDFRGRRDSSRGQDGRGDYQRKQITPAPEGMTARIMPIEDGLDALAKDITATGRTHSVFDIAWMVLGELDRFHVIFESENQSLYRSKKDHSLWLSQKECMAHFWSKGIMKHYYEEEIVEVDPPKGNFQSVARCGLSGVLIGPPNHHAYQKNILDLHREKFSNMALDRFKSKVIMEHSEEVVQEWLDSMKKHVRWRPKSEKLEVEEPEEEVIKDVVEPEAVEEEVTAEAPSSDDDPVAPPEPTEPTEEEVAQVEVVTPEVEQSVVILDNHLEVEQHFLNHGFEQEFEVGKVMSVLANVPAKMIDPGLMTLLKTTVIEERRYPGKLASILCRQMSGRHLAVFKWKKHLHCGPARPRNVSDNMSMAERPSQLFHWVIDKPGGKIDAMWEALLPKDVDDDARHLWYHDLHWLINEGIVLLFSDGKLHAAKELQKKKIKKTKKTKKSKKSKKSEKSGSSEVLKVEKVDAVKSDETEEKPEPSEEKEKSVKKDEPEVEAKASSSESEPEKGA